MCPYTAHGSPPRKHKIRVVILFLSEIPNEIHERECSNEIWKGDLLFQVMFVDHVPVRSQFLGELS